MSFKPLIVNQGHPQQLPAGQAIDVGGWTLPTVGGTVDYMLMADSGGNAVWSTDLSVTTLAVSAGISTTDYVQFDLAYSDGTAEGRLQWNSVDGTLEVGMPGGSVNLQMGQEMLVRCRNTTGSQIDNGKLIYISGQSGGKPLIALSKADSKATAIMFGMVTEDIPHNANGYVTVFGLVRDINTLGFVEGGTVFLSGTTAGGFEQSPATAPHYKARAGYVLTAHATEGVILMSPSVVPPMVSLTDVTPGSPSHGEYLRWDSSTTTWQLSPGYSSFYNGTFRETFDALVTSNGATITMSLEQSGTGDLTMQFSDGDTTLDCTDPLQTIALTAGTDDTSPQANYIYIPQSTKVLTKSISTWPAGEHIRVAYFLVPSATFVQNNGCYINQNWNDHLAGADSQGHMAHMSEKLRRLGAHWFSGVSANGATVSYFTIGAGTTDWLSTSGEVDQLHEHTFPAVDTSGSDVVLVVNQNGAAYDDITDLFSITADNTGSTISSNRYFNLVFWGVVNKGGEFSALMVNLPGGSYVQQDEALIDSNGYDVYDIPREFSIDSGTAFLIARVTFQMGSTWTHVSTTDLRGLSPATASGSSVNDHGALGGLTDDDHSGYHTDARADTWLAAGHETTYNHANYDTAFGWGNHAGLYDTTGTAAAGDSAHLSTYNHANYDTAFGWGDHASGGYLKANGSVALTADWAAGAYNITGLALLTVDNITIDAATIVSDTGAISFNDENVSTSGTMVGSNIPSPSADDQVLIATASGVAAWSSPTANQLLRSNDDSDTAWTDVDWPRVLTGDETVYVTKAGNDSTGDGSVSTPYLTIDRAIVHLNDLYIGATNAVYINIGAGHYAEPTLAMYHPFGSRCVFNGATAIEKASCATSNFDVAATSFVSGLEYYDFDLTLTGETVTVGDFVGIYEASAGTNPHLILGVHEVIAWDGGSDKATLRVYVRSSIGGVMPSGAIVGDTCAIFKTIVNLTSSGLKVDGPYHAGIWDDMVFAGDGTEKGVWVLNGAAVTLGNRFGTSYFDINLYCQNGATLYADQTIHSKTANQLVAVQNSATANLRSATLSGCKNQGLTAFIGATIQASDVVMSTVGSSAVFANQGAFINVDGCVIKDGKLAGSQVLLALNGAGIDFTGGTSSGYEVVKNPATNPGNEEAYIIGP